MKRTGKTFRIYFNRADIIDNRGSSMPIVMLVMLVVLIIGGAVAYAAVQMFAIVRNEEHNQMTYIAAESAIERTISNLDRYLTKEEFATDRSITFSNETQFINDIIQKLNAGDPQINNSFNIPVYADSSMNSADAEVSFSWDGSTYTRIGNKLKFPLQITVAASMENGIFRSYDRKAVAVKEYEVWIYNPFILNGAVYTLGDLVVKGSGTSTITDDVYVFGTGLDIPNRMDQYKMGGICVIDEAVLHIENGSVYTRNLLRVGTFDDTGPEKCAVIVDHDVVAQGIQAFGRNDDIVVIRDAYTFDDIEMNGANSYIAINGNYFGLNLGDGSFHDTSSAVINTSPRYAGPSVNEFTQSRIVISGYTFVNGSTFKMDGGTVGHKLENVALAWEGSEPVYIAENCSNTVDYINVLISNSHGERNGFSVLLGDVDWNNNSNLVSNWESWSAWISEIRGRASGRTNSLPSVPSKIKGFCHYAMAANNKLYPANEENIEIPASVVCRVADDVDGLSDKPLEPYTHDNWYDNTNISIGIPKGLQNMLSFLESHVHVFARKEYPEEASGEINYLFNSGMIQAGFGSTTEFLRIRNQLDDIDETAWNCIVKFGDDGDNDPLPPMDLISHIVNSYSDPAKYYLIINLDPDRELVITPDPDTGTDTVNGIIFTMGKVSVRNGATVNGSVIAAGRGYDPVAMVKGSAADSYDYDHDSDASTPPVKMTRLPRVVGNTNVSNFESWDYAALVIERGSIHFPGRSALFALFDEIYNGISFGDLLEDIF
mgnify:CR=1 FL=1|jgi:uncharacterized protein (UPF0333 family)